MTGIVSRLRIQNPRNWPQSRNYSIPVGRQSNFIGCSWIWRQPDRHGVRLYQPYPAITVIANQFFILLLIVAAVHLPRPYHFGAIDIRRVVDPLFTGIVIGL